MPILILSICGITLAILAAAPYAGWLVAFITKPIVDVGWSLDYQVFGFRPPEIVGAGVPALVLMRMLMFSRERAWNLPLGRIWAVYAATLVMGATMYLLSNSYLAALSFLLRALNGIIAFFSIYVYFSDRARFRALVIAMLIAGLFPMGIGFYESITGDYWRLRLGSGGQIRITGLYHNSTNLRYYAYITLTAIALYWAYFMRRGLLVRWAMVGYAVVCAVVVFKVYSKAGFVTVALVLLVWAVMTRRFFWPAMIVVLVLIVNSLADNVVFYEVERTFQKETAALEGTGSEELAFGGRLYFWREQVAQLLDGSIVSILIGGSDPYFSERVGTGGGHNDYIRAAMQCGVLGLIAYVWLMIAAGMALYRRAVTQRTPLAVVALCVFLGWVVETIGFTPSLYTNFQWYVWGIVGLALGGVRGLHAAPSAQRQAETARATPGGASGVAAQGAASKA